jgi:hypothetical protein
MDDSGRIRVLLVGESPQLFSLHEKHLKRKNVECEYAECEREVWEILGRRQFDLVLSLHTGQGTRSPGLVELLSGSATTLFYALRVEVGYWWVPILRLGEECLGAPALRPSEFFGEITGLLEEIEVKATWECHPSEQRSSPLSLPKMPHSSNRISGPARPPGGETIHRGDGAVRL